ncbi:DUF1579 family protein [Brevundimonas sp. VNH65]|uniref:DUF1579 family protein n=1 Tax=Brevundimonas sp. VNH65 TaxID=3400917 RepID=UPI003C06BF25
MTAAFLDRLIGDWTYEGHSLPDDGERRRGTETVSRRGAWTVIESDDDARFQLAFDPETGRVTGDFVHWGHPTLWTYDGVADGDRMVLASRGPTMEESGGETDYEDIWEMTSPDQRTLTSRQKQADGSWTAFCRTVYRRGG